MDGENSVLMMLFIVFCPICLVCSLLVIAHILVATGSAGVRITALIVNCLGMVVAFYGVGGLVFLLHS